MEESVTVQDLDKLVEEIFVAKDKHDAIGRKKAETNAKRTTTTKDSNPKNSINNTGKFSINEVSP